MLTLLFQSMALYEEMFFFLELVLILTSAIRHSCDSHRWYFLSRTAEVKFPQISCLAL